MSRTKRLSTLWTQHIKRKENEKNEDYKKRKNDFEAYVRNSKGILEVLEKAIDNKISEAEKSKEEDYDKASWPYLMADRQGQIRALKYIKETIQL
jgi:hypothetical protein|tara:strand:+ start:2240 stop:2524 length:285 start_codon:yes stop_codon:yes gene_type:complete